MNNLLFTCEEIKNKAIIYCDKYISSCKIQDEDLKQELYLHIMKSLKKGKIVYRFDEALEKCIFKICKNFAIDYQRKENSKNKLTQKYIEDKKIDILNKKYKDIDDLITDKTLKHLESVLWQLQYQLICLKFVDNLNMQQVSNKLGKSYEYVRYHYDKAFSKIKSYYIYKDVIYLQVAA